VAPYDFDVITTNCDLYSAAELTSEVNYWLHLYGRTAEGFSIALHVDFWPSLMVCLPDKWNQSKGDELIRTLLRQRKIPADHIAATVVYHHRLSGFHPDLTASAPQLATFPFLRIRCRSLTCLQTIRKFFQFTKVSSGGVQNHSFLVIEQDIPPVLELLEACHGRPSSGLAINKCHLHRVGRRLTHCDLEFECQLLPGAECPIQAIELDELYPIVLLSFDIECVPADGRSFPDANKAADRTVTICSTVKNLRTGEICRAAHTLGQHTLIAGDCYQFRYRNEDELLEEWRDFIIRVDPDIITGYNTHRFDWPYLNTRMQLLNPDSRFFFLSRLIQHRSVMEEKEFSSKAYGSSTTKQYDIVGRIDVDLCTYVMRNYKLKSYKLGHVGMHFVNQGKNELAIKDLIEHVQSTDEQKMRVVVEYCLQDAELPVLIWEDQCIMAAIVEMSRVTYVFLHDLFSRGQMFKVVSQMYINGRERGFALTQFPPLDFGATYKGATVLDIKSGFYRKLAVLDFASLYPSIMKGKNLCHTTLVTNTEQYGQLEHLGYRYYTTKTDLGEFCFEQTLKGLLPIMIDSLLEKRTAAKQLMKRAQAEGNSGLAVIYNARQLALKISCNSIYGFTGAQQGHYSCPQIASAVTTYGRYLIDTTKTIIEREFAHLGADVVYGDTDSVMVNFTQIPDTHDGFLQTFDAGEAASRLISSSFESTIKLEMEKVYKPALMQVKKHYAAVCFESRTDKGKIDAKGIALVRRDFCNFQQLTYAAVLDVLLYQQDLDQALAVMGSRLQLLIEAKIPFADLILSRQLSKDYKNDNVMQKVVADKVEQRTPGGGPRPGERVDFVVVVGQDDKTPMYQKVEDATYALEHQLPLDLQYYIDSFMPSMTTLFKPFGIDRRLKTLFAQFTAQAHRIVSGNNSVLDFFAPVITKEAEEPKKISMFQAVPAPVNKRKSVFEAVTVVPVSDKKNKSSLFKRA
jgi:DNA polymerase delta subunit 1